MKNNLGQFKKGNIPWCKGLTKETDGRLKESGKKISLAKLGKNNLKESKTKKRLFKEGIIKPSMFGKHHTEESRLKMSLSRINLYNNGYKSPSIGKKLNKKTKARLSESIKNLWKNENYKNKIIGKKRLKTSRTLKNLWKNNNFREKRIIALNKSYEDGKRKIIFKYPTNPELKLLKIIQDNNLPFNYVGDGKIWFRGENHSFNPDFLSKNPKHIIEMFGDYWHNLPLSIKRDKERLETYNKLGYKTLIIWEHELKNLDQILIKINKFMK